MVKKVRAPEDVLETTEHNHEGEVTTYHLVQINDSTAVFTDDSYNPVTLSIHPSKAKEKALENNLEIVDSEDCPEFEVSH